MAELFLNATNTMATYGGQLTETLYEAFRYFVLTWASALPKIHFTVTLGCLLLFLETHLKPKQKDLISFALLGCFLCCKDVVTFTYERVGVIEPATDEAGADMDGASMVWRKTLVWVEMEVVFYWQMLRGTFTLLDMVEEEIEHIMDWFNPQLE